MNIVNGIKKTAKYVGLPTLVAAATGAASQYIREKFGYNAFDNMNMLQYVKDTLIATAPVGLALIAISDNPAKNKEDETNRKYLFISTLVSGAVMAGAYFAGTKAMEWVADKNINKTLTTPVGGITGVVSGLYKGLTARIKKDN